MKTIYEVFAARFISVVPGNIKSRHRVETKSNANVRYISLHSIQFRLRSSLHNSANNKDVPKQASLLA